MKPEIVERSSMLLVGMIDSSGEVGKIDIHGLWEIYNLTEPGIRDQVDGAWYELHIGPQLGKGIYTVMVGVELSTFAEQPLELCIKTIPAGEYAHFRHHMADGDYREAFARVDGWVLDSGVEVNDFGLQRYGSDFNPENEDSVFDIYIPLA